MQRAITCNHNSKPTIVHNGVTSSVLSCSKPKTLSHHHGYNMSASQHDSKFSGRPLNDCHSQKPESHNSFQNPWLRAWVLLSGPRCRLSNNCANCSVKRTSWNQRNKFKPIKICLLLPNPVTTYCLPPRLHPLLAPPPPPPPLLRPSTDVANRQLVASRTFWILHISSHDALKWTWWQMQPRDPMAKNAPGFKRCLRLLNLQVRCCLFRFVLCPWLHSVRRSLFSFASQPASGTLNASSCFLEPPSGHLKTAHSIVLNSKRLHKQKWKCQKRRLKCRHFATP